MIKPQMPNIPGVGAVADTLDFVKNLWGSMSVPGISMPGMIAPSMSVEDLDKKIADLKAVEAWLNVNVSMLRGTIQAMEVQRGTIATLKSMGAALSNAVKQPGANEQSVRAAAPFVSAFFAQPAAEAPAPAAPPAPPAPEAAKPDSAAAAKPAASDAAAGLANPAAWWNMLQDQFKQAVSTAMSPDALASAGAKAFDAASKLGARAAAPVTKAAPAKASAPAKAAAAKPAAKPAARKRAPAKAKAG